jgi:uncharacterized protein YndB with AHSA1/START domain
MDVFNAFIDPAVTTKFWFTKGSARLEEGKQVQWDWEMYNFSAQVKVETIEPGKRIVAHWGSDAAGYTRIEWVFTPHGNDATFVEVTNSGFAGTGDEQVKKALDSNGGFTWVLAGLKAWLEHGIQLNLVADRFPQGK